MNQAEKAQERQRLANLISQWNQDHYDLFELSLPNEECEFHGVVRFYFQDGANVVTKCIRVACSATAEEVIDVLVEKFRPDMRMLTTNIYALFEVHANGEDRRILAEERILYVQLGWGKDVREGRFLMRREGAEIIVQEEKQQFRRNLSKREKKEKKKQDRLKGKENANKGAAEKLYTDMPETKFTRSISNPDAVMRRRRQQKVEKKLQQCRDKHGQGGTLKIYGDTLKPDIPYKTLLLSTSDTVAGVVRESMEKYGLENEDMDDFCLVQVLVPPGEREYHGGSMGEERIMEDQECPLAIAMEFPPTRGTVLFQLKRRSSDQKATKHKKLRAVSHDDLRSHHRDEPDMMPQNKLPYLIELHPDGSDNPNGHVHQIQRKFTEVGSDKSMAVIFAKGTNIQPRHCVIGLSPNDGIVTVTPTNTESETYVNNQRVYETTTIQNGMTVRLGKLNYFRFIDPNYEERFRKGPVPPTGPIQKRGGPYSPKPQETNFDVDGKVETMADHSPRSMEQPTHADLQKRSQSLQNMAPPREPERPPPQRRIEEALPAALEYREEKEDGFLTSVILDNNSGTEFKLAPTYTIYMALRYTLSNNYRADLSPADRAAKVTMLVAKVSKMVLQAIQSNCDNPATLAFWMANASEVLHFFKQDHDVHPFSLDAQEMLAESVQMAFHHLVRCLQYDLQRTMPAFLDESDSADDDAMQDDSKYRGKPILGDVLDTLSSAMNLLRRCRVNAALTIQLFSQLFHFINMWLFNIMVTGHHHEFCTRSWGIRLKKRLGRIETWAEKQGLELAADCHLCRIIQAAHLLQAPKSSSDDITDISSTCFKLNSLQLQELLQRYISEPGEPPIPQNLIGGVVSIAQNMADDLTKNDGREVQLEEDSDLQLPFLLPEDGYSCDTVRGIPNGLADFIEPFARAGLCRMVAQPASRGDWTVYMTSDEQMVDDAVQRGPSTPQPPLSAEPRQLRPQLPKEPEVMTVTFNKVNGSMGLSIVAAKGEGQKERGIYIKSVVPGGAAALDKRLQAGDQLLEVDSKSLVGLTQEKAAELMTRTGQTVSLKVAKQGAFYHGLANLLSQPSPVMQRAASPKKSSRPQEEGPPPYNGTGDMDRGRHHPGHRDQRQVMNTSHSRSSPSLNKYRRGVSHKDMEIIYGRKSALWRSILEADLREVKAKAAEKQLEELKDNARERSKSCSSDERYNNGGQQSHWDDLVMVGRSQMNGQASQMNGQASQMNGQASQMNGQASQMNGQASQMNGQASQLDDSVNGYTDEETEEKKKDLRIVQKELKEYMSKGLRPSGVRRHIRSKSITDLTDLSRSERRQLENAVLDRHRRTSINQEQQSQDVLRSKAAQMLSKVHQVNGVRTIGVSPEHAKLVNGYNASVNYNNQVNRRSHGYPNHQRPRSVGSITALTRDPNNNMKVDEYMRFKNSNMIMNSSSIPSLDNVSSSVISSSLSYGSAVFSGPSYDQNTNTSRSSSLGYGSDPSRHESRGGHSRHSLATPPSHYRDQYPENKPWHYSDSSSSRVRLQPSSQTSYGSIGSSNGSLRGRPTGSYITRNPRSKHITSAQQLRDGVGSDRMKATSTGNLRDQQMGHVQPPAPQDRGMQHARDPGIMSKSIPNLRMDNSFEAREPQHHVPPQQMRPAASVGALQHDYYNQSLDRRGDPRAHDYENQQSLDPKFRNNPDISRLDRGYPEAAQSLPMGVGGSRGPPSSRNSQSSFRDERPRSEYFGNPLDRPDLRDERPRSMEINTNKIHEWQQKYGMDEHPSQPSPHERSFDGRDPNYVNTTRSPPHSSPGYVNSGDIPKISANNEARQPNFYENTAPRQTEPQPAFHQMRKPQMEHQPAAAPKPMVATKPASRVMPVDIPRVDADNRQTQPHFFDPRMQQGHASAKPVSMNQSSYMAGQPHMVHSPGYNDPRNASLQRNQKFPSHGREIYNPHQSPELPSTPIDTPPELPPPPAGMDMDEDLPPLPPPPSQDYRSDPHMRDDMDPPYANQGDPRFNMPPHSYSSHNAPHQQPNYSQHHFQDPRHEHSMMAYTEPQRHPPPQQQPPAKPQHIHPQSYQPNHDYQNIGYEGRSPNRSFESQPQHSPGQNVYEPFENKNAALPPNMTPQAFMSQPPVMKATMPLNMAAPSQFNPQSKNRLVTEVVERTKDGKPLSSPWDREEKERIKKEEQFDMKKMREVEIGDLETRSYLSPQEQDRLRKLRLEQEFQRRVQEVEGRGEDEDDSDNDITNNTQAGREFMINTLKEDIIKAHKRMDDYNRKRMFDEVEKEKERKASLERKLEIFEKEKEDRLERIRKRQEKRQREQEEHLRKQKEMREKQRQDYEEQKRIMMAEEEKVRIRKMDEVQRRKDLEREQKKKAQEAREAEEKVLRAEARRREEEYQRQQQEQRDRERRDANRDINVVGERKRLEALTVQTQQQYQPYANLPSQYSPPDRYTINVPPPPARGSSYEAANRSNNGGPNGYETANRSNSGVPNSYNDYRNTSSTARVPPEPPFKKSVKFNTQLETQINTYNEEQARGQSVSSYRSSASDPQSPISPGVNSQPLDKNSNAFVTPPQQNHIDQKYRTTETTPTVIGAQEVYRDPRSRINAQKDSHLAPPNKKGQEKMSFRDKMKFFAHEAGEDTPKYKPKASKTLRNIESQLHNGQ